MKDLIECLFAKTETPSTLSADAGEIIRRVVPNLPHVGGGDIVRQIISFGVNFLNHKNTTGLLRAQGPMRLFVKYLLAGRDVAKVTLINDTLACFEKELQGLGIPKLDHRPLKPENPLLYFHLATQKYNAYPFLCLAFHRALKHVEEILTDFKDKGSLPQKKAEQRIESIVIPFIHSVRFYKADENDQLFTQSPSHDKIKQALKRGQGDSSVRYHKDAVVDAYIRDVLAALSGTYSPRSSKNITLVSWGRQISYGKKYVEEVITSDVDGNESSPTLPITINITFNERTEEEAAEGGYPIEEAEEILGSSDNDLARALALRQISPARFPSYWNKQSISLNSYSAYCHAATAKAIDAMTDEELAFLAFLVILIFFGFAPKKIANILIRVMPSSEEDLNSDTIYCDPRGAYFFYKMAEDQVASVFAQREDISAGTYHDSTGIVAMTTGVITTIVQAYINRTQTYRGARPFLFIFKDVRGKIQRFPLELFEFFGRALEEKCGPFPSVYAFPRSFFNYSTSRYNVDPIIAAYISDRVDRELRAPIFYTNISSERLNEDLIDLQTRFLSDIIENANICGIPMKQDMLGVESSDVLQKKLIKVFFGSKFVPELASMRETLSSIKDHIFNSGHPLVTRYNICTFYNMLLWELTCGFRQIEIERLDTIDIDTEGALIAVRGKGNRLYIEPRLIFMHPFVANIFEEVQMCRAGLIQAFVSNGRYSPSEIAEQAASVNTFSLLNARGQFVPASSQNVRRFLTGAGIEFPYKLNSQRHLLRTFMFDKKVQFKYLAAYLGHQTQGKEFLSYFSLDSLREMKDAISIHIDTLISELDLEIISHDHVVKNGKV